jgi:hypothetical protein
MKFELPQIPEAEQTPVVQDLLVLIENLIEHTQKQQEEIDVLKDDIKVLKGEKNGRSLKQVNLIKVLIRKLKTRQGQVMTTIKIKNHASVITKNH